jgi:hypothetical protein
VGGDGGRRPDLRPAWRLRRETGRNRETGCKHANPNTEVLRGAVQRAPRGRRAPSRFNREETCHEVLRDLIRSHTGSHGNRT